ncbi:hypothetical protein [Bacillus sp. FJAT-27445]|uniref:hypothetical protein n=1 Tax=Bacillus sp. FJAT-27445 TaxID=1679166 RepID=UPI0007438FF0|nr:hypothetical protein [Bacillus sp. FJAT-27445]
MAKNRYMLCLLLAIFFIYYAGPRLPLVSSGTEGLFTASWTILALLVIGGNLSGLRKGKGSGNVTPANPHVQKKRLRSRTY